MALTTLADVKTYCRVTDTASDDYLEMVRKGAEEAFKKLVGWRIERATYTDFLNGSGTPQVFACQVPVNQITGTYGATELGVWLDPNGFDGQGSGAFASTTKLTNGTDYYLAKDRYDGNSASGGIVRCNGVWPKSRWIKSGNLVPLGIPGQGNIKAVYVAGYAVIPDDIKLAIYEACKWLRMTRTTVGPTQSEGLGEYNYSAVDLTRLQEPFLRVGSLESIVRSYRRLRLQ